MVDRSVATVRLWTSNPMQLPNVDPETGKRDTTVPYKVMTKFRIGLDPKKKMTPCVGCNAVPSADGVVRIGDLVHVKQML